MLVSRVRESTDATASRSARRFWFDPRFAIGLALIVASVAGVVGIVSAADTRIVVYTARDSLAPGDRIDAGDLRSTSVRLEGAESIYLVPGDVPGDGLVVTRAVGEGELVPASAMGSAAGVREASVVLSVNGELAASVGPGSVVDVWAARESGGGAFEPPAVIVPTATVVRLVEPEGPLFDGRSGSIEVLVPRSNIARVLEAIANDDAVSIVPASLPGR
jgi:hypothetical protein